MTAKRIFGIVALVIGIVLVGFSSYIKSQVAQGKVKIDNAQKQVDQGSSLFSLSPATKEVGKGITDSAQKNWTQQTKWLPNMLSTQGGSKLEGSLSSSWELDS